MGESAAAALREIEWRRCCLFHLIRHRISKGGLERRSHSEREHSVLSMLTQKSSGSTSDLEEDQIRHKKLPSIVLEAPTFIFIRDFAMYFHLGGAFPTIVEFACRREFES